MIIKRIRPIVVKEFRQIRRDPRSLIILLVFPAVLVMLIGYALNFDVKHISLAVFDQSKSAQSREFIRSFSNVEYFDVAYAVESYREADRLLSEGKVMIALVIPSDFSRDLTAGHDADIQILVDGSNANTATTAIGYATILVQTYSSTLASRVMERQGRELFLPIDVRPRVWYNPELSSAKFLVPGLIGFILMISAVISTSLSVVREKERGTIEQIIVSPLTTIEVILGKTIAYLMIALLAATFVLVTGFLLFDISIRGSIIWLYTGIVIFLLGALGQGLLISTIAQTQQVAFMISVFSSLLPSFLLSGFVFPIRSMPLVLQIISNITPSKFFLVVVRSVILKGVGPSAFWDQLVYMAIFATVTVTISSMRLLKKGT
ncbi:MAG: ABC transporter permease [Ignavibacteria bacterium]|nr:ABC transporter permease [Ignavibacteria bacterium]MBI3766591.1 ABC transporter permease [Ignavibacteriales bacterium]